LYGARLNGAILRQANFTNTSLENADLTNADLAGVIWNHTLCPNGQSSDVFYQCGH
jgi:uncharacterized protein YjbI with pentapeptide repeats